MDTITIIFSIVILILSIMFHELAHGTVADRLGDPTARLRGRLTLNPFAHLELVGSLLVPLMCIVSGAGFIVGWAKPVPFTVAHLKYKRWGPAIVAAAGPAMNLAIAIICAVLFRFIYVSGLNMSLASLLAQVVIVNISLAIFNLLPVPPLDGHHILGSIFPHFREWSDRVMRQYGIIILVAVLLIGGRLVGPLVAWLAQILLL